MISVGIDVGSSATKAVLLQNGAVRMQTIIPTQLDSASSSRTVFEKLLMESAFSAEAVNAVVATGYGRINVPFADRQITEISCHAKGIHHCFPEVRTVLDIGGQDVKVIRVTETGGVGKFIMNDKCSAGTGRYLERIARMLGISVAEIGELSLHPVNGPAPVSDFCTVFAQQDVLTLIRKGVCREDILAGVCEGLLQRILSLIYRLGMEEDFAVSGGIAKNIGVVSRLEKRLGVPARLAQDPQIIGALGAALYASSIASNKIATVQKE